jgi:hypothetical protein
MSFEVIGGTPVFERLIRSAIEKYPSWCVNAARISRVIVSNRPDIKSQIAMFEHGTRDLYVWPGVGDLLQKAIGHELGHAIDDNFGHPHFFTSTAEWLKIHAAQSYFDIDKYRDEPLEYFADCFTKLFLLGPQKFATTNPMETKFITSWVIPTLQKEFS